MSRPPRFFATCGQGIEPWLFQEAQALGLPGATQAPGGVAFDGDRVDGMRACLWLRSATRVLEVVGGGPARSETGLYKAAKAVPWERWLTPETTFRVDATVAHSALTHSGYVALKTKDGLVDRLRQKLGSRPSVSVDDPQAWIRVRLYRDQVTFALDLAGYPLHLRGLDRDGGIAPLKETLAAALALATDWDGTSPLYDPFCGTGTLAVEAAWIHMNRAPGLDRVFGFEGLADHAADPWSTLIDEALAAVKPQPPGPIILSDWDAEQRHRARQLLDSAEIKAEVKSADARSFTPTEGPGVILTNPPYGERLDPEGGIPRLYRAFGDRLKSHGTGCTLHMITTPACLKTLGLRTERKLPFYNGDLDCRLVRVPLFQGARKDQRGRR
ncbi:MAG: class I SAM-dependent RNA methyltransferase [Bradymonadia bacterium]